MSSSSRIFRADTSSVPTYRRRAIQYLVVSIVAAAYLNTTGVSVQYTIAGIALVLIAGVYQVYVWEYRLEPKAIKICETKIVVTRNNNDEVTYSSKSASVYSQSKRDGEYISLIDGDHKYVTDQIISSRWNVEAIKKHLLKNTKFNIYN